jgi:hypothetical protein
LPPHAWPYLRAFVVLAAAPALMVASLITAPTAALATTGAPHVGLTATGTQYAVGVPACPHPQPGHAQCLAVMRKLVSANTPGARAIQPAASADGVVSAGQANGMTPADLATAYGVNPDVGGAGQTVAVIDAFNDPNVRSDLDTFDEN